MVKLFVVFYLSVSTFSLCFAQEGVITVLEAPLFRTPDQNGKVIQYQRKGDKIYIHPAEFAKDRYDGLIDETREDFLKYNSKYQKDYQDKLFANGETYFPAPDSKFYKTLAKSGVDAYILKEHIFLLYKDSRELDQKVVAKDPTDYRIEEPIPKGYPLAPETGYRGQLLYSMGTPSTRSYPYSENIEDSAFDYDKEIILVWSRQVDWDLTRRFFFGGTFYLHTSTVRQSTENITAQEDLIRLGVGPYLSYDVWRTKKNIINFYGALTFNFYDNMEITQKVNTLNISDKREYKTTHFTARIGSQFFVRDILSAFDLVIGANLNFEAPHTYEAYTDTEYPTYWQDSFDASWSVQQSYFIGLQSDY